MLTYLLGPSARVTAAAAAAQAGAALVETVGHQPGYCSSLRALVYVMCSQHVFIQMGREAAATTLSFILQGKDRWDLEDCFKSSALVRIYQLIKLIK